MSGNAKGLYDRDPMPVTNPNEGKVVRYRNIGDRLVPYYISREEAQREERRQRLANKAWSEMDRL